MSKIYQVLIIGAGQIGAFYDQPGNGPVLTHAHAFSPALGGEPGFELVGFVEPDAVKGQEAAARWQTRHFASLQEAFNAQADVGQSVKRPIDVACIAVPDVAHAAVLRELADYPVRLVFAEKPFTRSVQDALDIASLYEERRIPILVNYTRRFVPEFHTLQQAIRSGQYGRLLAGTASYGKGTIHNGAHMINLLQWLLGDVVLHSVQSAFSDFDPADPTVTATLAVPSQAASTSDSPGQSVPPALIALCGVDCRAVTTFEFDLMFERKRVRMLDSGRLLGLSDVVENPVFAGYRKYGSPTMQETGLFQAMRSAACHIKYFLDSDGQASLMSPVADALETLRLCWQLQTGGLPCDASAQDSPVCL